MSNLACLSSVLRYDWLLRLFLVCYQDLQCGQSGLNHLSTIQTLWSWNDLRLLRPELSAPLNWREHCSPNPHLLFYSGREDSASSRRQLSLFLCLKMFVCELWTEVIRTASALLKRTVQACCYSRKSPHNIQLPHGAVTHCCLVFR